MKKINVTVWHEFRHEKHKPEVRAMFPEGIHMTIKSFLDNDEELNVRTATLDEPECGVPDEVLDDPWRRAGFWTSISTITKWAISW